MRGLNSPLLLFTRAQGTNVTKNPSRLPQAKARGSRQEEEEEAGGGGGEGGGEALEFHPGARKNLSRS